jgi:hypothetical protein
MTASTTTIGAWIEVGRDERAALRSTCHAAEALHKLAFASATEGMSQKATFWLTYLPEHTSRPAEDLARAAPPLLALKTLAFLGHFEDAQLQRDFRGCSRSKRTGCCRAMASRAC